MKTFYNCLNNIKLDFNEYMDGSKGPIIFCIKFFHNPGMLFSILYRTERYFIYESNFLLLNLIGYILYPFYFVITYFILSYHIEPRANIMGGLFLHNRDIVITNDVEIGKNFYIMGQTTIGTGFDESGKITIGNNVRVGAGAKIISTKGLTIADNVDIGANAVVCKSILEANSIHGGIPSKLIRFK